MNTFKTIVVWVVGVSLFLAVLSAGIAYLTIYPRHYEADEFQALLAIADDAESLRSSSIRGSIPEHLWSANMVALSPRDVRVYPSGVLVPLRGFFSFESGLYFPSKMAATNIEKMPGNIYMKIGDGIYSYKVEG